jgi:TonB family protein
MNKLVRKLSSLQISVIAHASLVLIILIMTTDLFTNKKQIIDLNIYVDPILAQVTNATNSKPVDEVIKKPETSFRKVFGVSRKSVVSNETNAMAVKAGNTVAKSNDNLELNKDDLDSLPIPVADYLITDEPSVIFEPKNKQRTEEARRNGYTGTARLKILIDQTGIVREVKLVNSLKYGLDERAIELAKQVKLSPAKVNGKPVAVIRDFTITFKATD